MENDLITRTKFIDGYYYPQYQKKCFIFWLKWVNFVDINNPQIDPNPHYLETDPVFYYPLKFKTKKESQYFLKYSALKDYILNTTIP